MSTPTNTCEDCKYFEVQKEDETTGFCHRRPPTVVFAEDEIQTLWPAVGLDDWCGEYMA